MPSLPYQYELDVLDKENEIYTILFDQQSVSVTFILSSFIRHYFEQQNNSLKCKSLI